MKRNLPILLVLCTFFIFFRGKACDNSTITIANQVTNPDGSITYTLNLFVDLGSLDAVFYGFVLKFNSAYNTPTVVIGGTYPTTNPLSNTNLTSGSISGTLVPKTGSAINSIVNDSDWNFYDNQTNVISYESSQLFGATSLSFNTQIQVTVSGCVETILFDASVNSGAPQCEYLVSTGQNCSPCSIAAPTFSSVTQPTCATSTGSFTITNYVGTNTYSSSPPTGISFSSSSVTASPGTYTITASNGSCTNTASVTINAQPAAPASPTFSTVTQPTCTTPTGSFTITNYIGSNTYSSSPPTGISFSSGSVTASPGTYTITASNGSCTNTASLTINAQPAAPASPIFSSVTQPTCTTSTGSFTITNYIGTNTYSSSPPTGISFSSGSVTASPGTYVITASNGSCTNTASVTINAQPASQTPTFNQISGICPGGSFTLPPSSLEGISGAWSPPINNSTTTQYTFTPASGCANTATMTVSVNSSVTPTFTPSGPYCQNAILAQVMLPSSSIEGITGTWNPGMISTANAGDIVHSFTADAGQCATNTTMTIVVNAEVLSTFTQVEPVCEGGTFVLPSSSLEGIPGSWSPPINDINSTPYTFTPDGGECATTASMTVSIISTVTPSFTQIDPVCNLQSVTISNTSNNGITGSWSLTSSNASGGLFTFTPDAGQCATSTTMTVVLTSPQPQFTQIDPICPGETFTLPTTSNDGFTGSWSPAENFNTTTNYTFTPGANQCAASATMTVSVLPVVTPTFTNPGPLCAGDPLQLPATSNEGISGSWTPTIENTTTTTYTFTPDAGQCATTSTLTVVINPIPTAVFSSDVNQGCVPLTVNFTNMSSGSALCTWNMGNGVNIEDCSTVSYTFQQAGCYDISLTVTTQTGCSATTTANDLICASGIPIADFSASTYFIDEFHTLVDFENETIGGTSYEWLFGDSTAISTAENPSHDYAGNNLGNYLVTLVAFSPQGCIDSAFATIIFQEQLIYYIPNAFTPDGNEFNQTFQPIFTAGFDAENFELFIYNRWGELIFETKDANDGWDGSIGNGSSTALAPDGIYTWKVNIKLKNNDDRKTAVGHVNLVR